ncbi:uncharacterized protein LOC130657650 [Hydractinia symbiolongicarpus]|uniref:uncharacterized protein LOC130657650 n=1 Tax=Hydractinia symbiolongicarpus TaxID=13093 RepID=UPI00254A91BC|nr:uncharacterized protein LOC130657650 [Hydractinia symbiolongicarpus]
MLSLIKSYKFRCYIMVPVLGKICKKAKSEPYKSKSESRGDPWKDKNGSMFLNMLLEKKRTFYKCGDTYVTPESHDLIKWPLLCATATHKMKKCKTDKDDVKHLYKVMPELNNKVCIWQGDITRLEIDAIVNAANQTLLGGGGVDGCIHRAAGPTLVEECRSLNGCQTGATKITSGHKLPAKYVLHTVGPMVKNEQKLKGCYETCLQFMLEYEMKSIAFPCIATGIYGYPNREAAHVALQTVREWLEKHPGKVDKIIFCTFMEKDYLIYHELMKDCYFPCAKQPTEGVFEDAQMEISNLNPDEKKLKEKEVNTPCENKDTTLQNLFGSDSTQQKDSIPKKSGVAKDSAAQGFCKPKSDDTTMRESKRNASSPVKSDDTTMRESKRNASSPVKSDDTTMEKSKRNASSPVKSDDTTMEKSKRNASSPVKSDDATMEKSNKNASSPVKSDDTTMRESKRNASSPVKSDDTTMREIKRNAFSPVKSDDATMEKSNRNASSPVKSDDTTMRESKRNASSPLKSDDTTMRESKRNASSSVKSDDTTMEKSKRNASSPVKSDDATMEKSNRNASSPVKSDDATMEKSKRNAFSPVKSDDATVEKSNRNASSPVKSDDTTMRESKRNASSPLKSDDTTMENSNRNATTLLKSDDTTIGSNQPTSGKEIEKPFAFNPLAPVFSPKKANLNPTALSFIPTETTPKLENKKKNSNEDYKLQKQLDDTSKDSMSKEKNSKSDTVASSNAVCAMKTSTPEMAAKDGAAPETFNKRKGEEKKLPTSDAYVAAETSPTGKKSAAMKNELFVNEIPPPRNHSEDDESKTNENLTSDKTYLGAETISPEAEPAVKVLSIPSTATDASPSDPSEKDKLQNCDTSDTPEKEKEELLDVDAQENAFVEKISDLNESEEHESVEVSDNDASKVPDEIEESIVAASDASVAIETSPTKENVPWKSPSSLGDSTQGEKLKQSIGNKYKISDQEETEQSEEVKTSSCEAIEALLPDVPTHEPANKSNL